MYGTVMFGSLVRVWALRDTQRTIFRAISEQFQNNFRAISEQFQSSSRAISERFQSSFFYTIIFVSLVRVWASRDTTLQRTIFRAVYEQFQSNFKTISEQFQSNFRVISEWFQSSSRAISEQFQSSFLVR